jgi:hypothetical protein
LKALEKEKHALSPGRLYLHLLHNPFVFPFLTFRKSHLHPCVLFGFFYLGKQGSRSSENWFCLQQFGHSSQETDGEVPGPTLILITIFPSALPREWAELCP